MAEQIEILFWVWIHVGPRNYVLDEGPDLPMGRGNCEWQRAAHCKVEGLCTMSCAKTVH